MKKFIAIICGLWTTTACAALPDSIVRPVNSHFTYDIGSSIIANTYLTPLKYTGWGMRIGYDRTQAMKFRPEHMVQRITAGIDLDRTLNPAGNAKMWRLTGDFDYGITYRMRLPQNITVAGGLSTGIDLGVIYNTRNGNNPVAVEAAWTINITGALMWHHTLLGKSYCSHTARQYRLQEYSSHPAMANYFTRYPSGDHSGLAHCAWWGNYFRMENLLTADISFRSHRASSGLPKQYPLDTRQQHHDSRGHMCRGNWHRRHMDVAEPIQRHQRRRAHNIRNLLIHYHYEDIHPCYYIPAAFRSLR